MDYSLLLYQVGNFIWLGYVLALCLAFFLKVGDKSYYFGATVLVMANLVMQGLEPGLVELSNYDKELVRAIWYPVWAICDLAAIYVIYQLHSRSQCSIQFVSKSLVLSLAALSVLQAIRYFDQFVLATNWLAVTYKVAIISINLGCLVIVMSPITALVMRTARRTRTL